MAPPFKFPNPADYALKIPAVMCPADRVINLYNQDHKDNPAQRISKTVRDWFFQRAHAVGWGGAHFLPEVQSNHGAGCILWAGHRGAPQQIVITQQTLVLLDSPDEE